MPERYPFPNKVRILTAAEYRRVFSQGAKVSGRYFTGFVVIDAAQESRLGLVVSRKVGSAVVRNHVKRLIREYYRRNRFRFPRGMQLVVLAQAASALLDGPSCDGELERLLGRWLRDA